MFSDLPRLNRFGNQSLLMWAASAYLARITLAIVLYYAFQQREYTDDIRLHLQLASDPLYFFFCRNAFLSQQPPLLGLIETSLLPLTQILGPFFGPRLSYAAWDVLGSVILVGALRSRQWDTPAIRAVIFFGPLNIYASVVSAQDESISYCLACLCAALILRGRPALAFLLACLATVACKILFLPLAVALVPFLLRREHMAHLIGGITILLAPYWIASECHYPAGNFALPAPHTINAWQTLVPYFQNRWADALKLSLVIAAAVSCLQLAYVSIRPRKVWPLIPDPILSYSIVLLSFLGFSYHVVPEYFLLLTPLIIVYLLQSKPHQTRCIVCFVFAMAMPILPDVLRYFVRFNLGPEWIPYAHKAASFLVSILCLFISLRLICFGKNTDTPAKFQQCA